MQMEFFAKIKAGLSEPRLNTYGQDNAEDITILSRYLLNAALSEALYPLLQGIEICLRNEIDRAVSEKYGRDWITAPADFLDRREKLQIGKAKAALRKDRKPETRDYLIAELSFGFWTSLLDRRYERTLWQTQMKNTFREMPKADRTRKHLCARFNQIRKLRNRVFHHGRIIHWKDLPKQHRDIIEAVGWISPQIRELTEKLDTFETTFRAGLTPWTDKIRTHWPKTWPRQTGNKSKPN